MAKSELKIKARNLRKSGNSIKDIARDLHVPKSTISGWCSDIELTERQIEALMQRKEGAIRRGQINGALKNKQKRLEIVRRYEVEGLKAFPKLSRAEYFIAGLVLYLAEGSKKDRNIDFVNSDPAVIKFMLHWFYMFFDLNWNNFVFRVSINKIHQSRDSIVQKYWADFLKVPMQQFRKTVFLKSKQNKRYENHETYFGTFRFRMLKSTDLSYRILGLISAILKADIAPA